MKTKNIFRMLLVAATLLLGANNVKADDILFSNPDGWESNYNGQQTFPLGTFADASVGDVIKVYCSPVNQGYPTDFFIKLFGRDYNEIKTISCTLDDYPEYMEFVIDDDMLKALNADEPNWSNVSGGIEGRFMKVTLVTLGSATSGPETYKVSIDVKGPGTVTLNNEGDKFEAETAMSLTVSPNEGYVLLSITATDKDGETVELGEGYSFTMPASRVTISAIFAPATIGEVLWSGYQPIVNDGSHFDLPAEYFSSLNAGDKLRVYGVPTNEYNWALGFNNSNDGNIGYYQGSNFVYQEINLTEDILKGLENGGYLWGENIALTAITYITLVQYETTLAEGLEHVEFTIDKQKAEAGETVKFTIKPEDDYVLNSFTVSTASGTEVDYSAVENEENAYTFTMPEENVVINATVTAIDYSITTLRSIWSDESGFALGDANNFQFRSAYFNYLEAGDVIRLYGSSTGEWPNAYLYYKGENGFTSLAQFSIYTWKGFSEIVLTDDMLNNLKSDRYFAIGGYNYTITDVQLIKKAALDYSWESPHTLLDFTESEGKDLNEWSWDEECIFSYLPFKSAIAGNILRIYGTPIDADGYHFGIKYRKDGSERFLLHITNYNNQNINNEGIELLMQEYTWSGSYVDIELTDAQVEAIQSLGGLEFLIAQGDKFHFNKLELISLGEAYNITTEAANGTINVKSKSYANTEVTFTVTANTGYRVGTVTVAGQEVTPNENGEYTFTMPENDVEIAASFVAIDYNLTIDVNNTDMGSVTVESETYNYLQDVTLTVTTNDGYELRQLAVYQRDEDGEYTIPVEINTDDAANNNYTFTMPASDVKVVATFGPIGYAITYESDGNGTVSGYEKAAAGETVELSFEPNTGYQLYTVAYIHGEDTVQITANEGVYSFEMPQGPVTVRATFKAINYIVNIESNITGGKVTTDRAVQIYRQPVVIYATPDEDYYIKEIRVTDYYGYRVDVDNNNTFIMPASDVTVNVIFAEYTYSVSSSTSAGGYISFSTPTSGLTKGSEVTFTAYPDDGYMIDQCNISGNVGDISSYGNTYTFTIGAANANVYVSFKEVPLTSEITLSSNASSVGVCTFAANFDVDYTALTGAKAYIASGTKVDNGETVVTLQRLRKKVVAGTPVIIVLDEKSNSETTLTLTKAKSGAESVSGNLLKRGTNSKVKGENIYVLSTQTIDGEVQAIFAQANLTAALIPTDKAYLELPTSAARARTIRFSFGGNGDDTTGINSIGYNIDLENAEIYNLSGQKVEKPSKGVYIINGKKVYIK